MIDSLRVTCSKNNLKEIRQFVGDKLKEYSVSEVEANMIVLAVDEVCSNLIIHSNECDENKYLDLNIHLEHKPNEGVLFKIYDTGKQFDYNTYHEPNLSDIVKNRTQGSLGLMLVRRIMDKIEFKVEDSQNVCTLFKRLTPVSLV